MLSGCISHDVPTRAATTRIDRPIVSRAILRGPLGVIPRPRDIALGRGSLMLPAATSIGTSGAGARDVAAFLVAELRRYRIATRFDDGTATTIRLTVDTLAVRLGDEGYRFEAGPSGIAITGRTRAGLFYGVQTLAQLLCTNGRSAGAIPYVRIVDWPQYPWRGVHLDVSRHFFPVAVVERYIDLASRFKLNTFHWHLTDDQGWRIEIRAYPRLTSVGGCRGDAQRACHFYSQEQIRAVVAYAKARYVTIIPEIEGPGHSVEALAAYPFLACAPGAYATLERWGSSTSSVCPTERAFAFYDTVFREISTLFPAPLIHIGGDEVPYDAWRASPYVAALMRREHLATYGAVQAYFTHRLATIARASGRRIVGWDEIDAPGIPRDAIVMAWTGENGAVEAVRHGHDVVVSPDPPLYFDAYQGDPRFEPRAFPGSRATLEAVYAFDPLPATLTPAQRAHILGAQANLWTEYVATAQHLWYMAYPRTLALAELCWTPRSRMTWHDFAIRLGPSLLRLEADGVPFRVPEGRYRLTAATMRSAVP